jgi:hypothetical protein
MVSFGQADTLIPGGGRSRKEEEEEAKDGTGCKSSFL